MHARILSSHTRAHHATHPYLQVEAMLRHYKVATLLVEFQSDKAFGLQNK